MRYADGNVSELGDLVRIDGRYRGTVVACIDEDLYLPGHEEWAYLGSGIMVDTDFGGLIHYTQGTADELVLERRCDAV